MAEQGYDVSWWFGEGVTWKWSRVTWSDFFMGDGIGLGLIESDKDRNTLRRWRVLQTLIGLTLGFIGFLIIAMCIMLLLHVLIAHADAYPEMWGEFGNDFLTTMRLVKTRVDVLLKMEL